MGYIVEAYRENSEKTLRKLHEAKMAICEAIEALEEDNELMERGNYRNYRGRMNRRHDYSDRYDY